MARGGGELHGQAGDDKLFGGPTGSTHLSGGSGSNIMMSSLQRSDDQATWILAQGKNDQIMARSFTAMKIESQSAYILVLSAAQAQIQIEETAGNTETVTHGPSSENEDTNVNFTGRNEAGKDTHRSQNASHTDYGTLWPHLVVNSPS